jgi:type IV pilus assembly protein PilW
MPRRNFPSRMAGVSLIELMIAIALGLIILAGLATLFANQSAARAEMERSSRQIENGRFAMELLGDDLRTAGFYGELNVRGSTFNPPSTLVDPCSFTPADWNSAIPFHVVGYDNGASKPTCVGSDIKPNTDVLVVRRVSTCEAGAAGCGAVAGGKPYIQVSRCVNEVGMLPALNNLYEIGLSGTQAFTRTQRDCTTRAALRQYYTRIYYISTDNGAATPLPIPTLKRLEFDDTTSAWVTTPLVEGIEEFQLEYGIDIDGDGDPDGYTADPNTFNPAGCVGCTPTNNWANVMTVRIHLLARNIEPSVNYTDPKTYTLGRDAANAVISVTPSGADATYRRHAYASLVRIVNAAERRDTP